MSYNTIIQQIKREISQAMAEGKKFEANKDYWWGKAMAKEEEVIDLHKKLNAVKLKAENGLYMAHQAYNSRQPTVKEEPSSSMGERSDSTKC